MIHKTQTFAYLIGLSLSLIFFSCNENGQDEDFSKSIIFENDRLVFSTFGEFEKLISEVNQEQINTLSSNILEKYKSFPKFNPLSKSISENSVTLAVNLRSISTDEEFLADSISELIPDMSLRLFLNDNMEIEIENQIFKITPLGTFYSINSNYETMLTVINEFEKLDKIDRKANNGNLSGIEGGEDVYFIDTFSDKLDSRDQPTSQTTTLSVTDNTIYQANDFMVMAPYLYALPKADYQNFTTYNYGAQTDIGKLIEGIAGGNSDFEQNYNSTYRLRVKLYDFNYYFYRSVGLNAKLQKKGWTGIWALNSDVKAEKLVLGWDGLLLNIKIPYAMPIGYAGFPTKGVSQEILNFTNFSLPTGNITDVRIPFLGVQSFSYNDLEKMLKKILKVSYSQITKEIWTEAETSLASASYEIKQENVKSYRKVFPDEIKLALSRHEISGSNINELSFVIDRYAGLTYKSTGTGTLTSFSKNVIEPTLSSAKKMYEIEAASVYGASVFLYEMKGIRVIKEIND